MTKNGSRSYDLEGAEVLIYALDCPHPTNHGGRLDVWNRARALSNAGAAVTVICTTDNSEEAGDYFISKIHILCNLRKRSFFKLINFLPFQWASRKASLADPSGPRPNLVVSESEYLAPLLRASSGVLRVVRQHNFEPRYLSELAELETNFWRSQYLKIEAMKTSFAAKRVEQRLRHWCISADEISLIKKHHPSASCYYVPPCFLESDFNIVSDSPTGFCLIGRLDGPDSRAVLNWYESELHPSLTSFQGFHMTIAGRISDVARAEALQTRLGKSATVIANPTSTKPILKKSLATIIPVHGLFSGVKMKVVEAVCAGLEIITTPSGISGLPESASQHIFVCEEIHEYFEAITFLSNLNKTEVKLRRERRILWANKYFSESSYVEFVKTQLANVPLD